MRLVRATVNGKCQDTRDSANETELSQELQQVISKVWGHPISLHGGVSFSATRDFTSHISWGISQGHMGRLEVKRRLITKSPCWWGAGSENAIQPWVLEGFYDSLHSKLGAGYGVIDICLHSSLPFLFQLLTGPTSTPPNTRLSHHARPPFMELTEKANNLCSMFGHLKHCFPIPGNIFVAALVFVNNSN